MYLNLQKQGSTQYLVQKASYVSVLMSFQTT